MRKIHFFKHFEKDANKNQNVVKEFIISMKILSTMINKYR